MLPLIFSQVVGWAKAHHFCSLEFEERGESPWAFMRTWEKGTFRLVVVDVADRFAVDATHEIAVLRSVVAAVGDSASLVTVSGGSHVLADKYREYVGSGYSNKLVEYPIYDLRLLKRCLQKVSSSVFGSLDHFSMTKFFVTRPKGAEHRSWMMSRSSLRRAIITGELSMPSLVEVISNIVGVWPLIVVYLQETGRKTDGNFRIFYEWYNTFSTFLIHLQFSLLRLAVFPFLERPSKLGSFLGNCWMGCLNLVGSEGRKSTLQRLNSTLLCVSSDRWKQAAIDLVGPSTACLPFAVSPVSVLGGIFAKLVLLCFNFVSIFSSFNTCAALDLSVDSISCEGSFRAASLLYCVVEWGCH